MPYCKACGMEVGNPEEDLHDPEGLSDIAQKVLGGPIENEDAHVKVIDGPKGWRYFCRPSGKTTAIVENPPNVEGEGGGPNAEPEQSGERAEKQPVYDVQEEKSQAQLLAETVTNPTYGLNEGQVEEIKDWAEIYDGHLPPDVLEKVIRNFSGVAKQTASLVREKYEAKLNRWTREQTQDSGGPPIGVMSSPPRGSSGRSSPRPSPEPPLESTEEQSIDDVRRGRRRERRRRAMERRQDALDEATAEAVKEGIQEMTGVISDTRSLLNTILKAKAEKDPEWFFENIDLLEALGEPSEARKRELEAGREIVEQASVDREVDSALDAVEETDTVPQSDEPRPPEQDTAEDDATGDQFNELFGDIEESMEAE